MADNTELNPGGGGDHIATDDINGIKHQRVKVQYGIDGAATDVSSVAPLPVVLGSAPGDEGPLLTEALLTDILDELRLMNFHLSLITDNTGLKDV